MTKRTESPNVRTSFHATSRAALCGGLVSALALLGGASPAMAAARFGTMCQQDYQNGWADINQEGWNRCGWFNDELDDTDTKVFYINLHNAQRFFYPSNDQDYPENVDLMYVNTHGLKDTVGGYAALAMWDDDDSIRWASSTSMYLGNEGYGLSIMASYACDTLRNSPRSYWSNWSYTFKGGLRIMPGSHDTVWFGDTTNEQGEDFADELQASETFWDAWEYSIEDFDTDNDAAIVASGNSTYPCATRRDTMKWQNYSSDNFPRLRDADVTTLCRRYIDNI